MFNGSPEEPNLIFKKYEALSTEQKQKIGVQINTKSKKHYAITTNDQYECFL
jgi:hypothetical protein